LVSAAPPSKLEGRFFPHPADGSPARGIGSFGAILRGRPETLSLKIDREARRASEDVAEKQANFSESL
jgi:hypothetical protein